MLNQLYRGKFDCAAFTNMQAILKDWKIKMGTKIKINQFYEDNKICLKYVGIKRLNTFEIVDAQANVTDAMERKERNKRVFQRSGWM